MISYVENYFLCSTLWVKMPECFCTRPSNIMNFNCLSSVYYPWLWWQSATFGFYLHINIFCALLGVWAGHFARDHCKSRKMIPELFLYSNNDYYLSFQYLETMVLGEFLTWVSAGWEIIFWNVLEKLGWLKTTLGLDSASKSPPRIKNLQEKL